MPGGHGHAAKRWHRLVSDRLAEWERLSPGQGPLDGAFWDRRAERHAAGGRLADGEADPFLRRLRRVAERSSTAIDVGAGTGRFALPLAAGVDHVTAVDPSAAMLARLQRQAGRLGLGNVSTLEGRWEEAATEVADIVFSAFVLPLVPDAAAFVRKLEETARRHVLLYLGAFSADAVLDPLWRHFHGAPRVPGPTYLDSLALLGELGVAPDVKVVEVPNRKRFATVGEAVEHYLEGLLLADTPEVRQELEGLLSTWLMGRRGAFRSPLRTSPAAIIHWRPRARP
ncbi:MAG TPA: class I SAM-dependent methyltransferase [Thermoleophilaceae bacterium]|nr:class I SAM-dependent methyltransferase [Thermoleophilaceae bacterium]